MVLTVILLIPTAFPGPTWLKIILGLLVISALFAALINVMRRLAYYYDETEPGKWGVFFNLLSVGVLIAAFVAIVYAMEFLEVWANGGRGLSPANGNWGLVSWAELVVFLVILWLLIGVPNQAFILVDNDGKGDAQRVLVGLIRAAACALTAVYLLLLHFNGGPLSKLERGPLVVGIVAAIVLAGPFYKSVATVFWRRGLAGAIRHETVKQYWGNAPSEVRKAFDQSEPPPKDTFWGRIRVGAFGYKGLGAYWFKGLSGLWDRSR